MANHKRGRPKHQRAGCLLCKPYKDERVKGQRSVDPVNVRRKLQDDIADLEDEGPALNECDGDCEYCRGEDEGAGSSEAA